MSYQSDKVLLGSTQSTFKTVENVPGSISAGKVIHSKADGTFTVAAADGAAIGVSVGRSLSDIARTSVVKRGTRVPLRITDGFDPVIGTQVFISDTTGLGIATGAGATGVNAVYSGGREGGTGVNNGLDEDGSYVGVAYIDMPGGL